MDLPLDPALEDLLNTPLDLDSLGHSGLQANLPIKSCALPALIPPLPAGLFDVLDVDPFADTPASARRQLHRNAYSANDLASLAREPEPEPGLDLQFLGSLPRIPEASGTGPVALAGHSHCCLAAQRFIGAGCLPGTTAPAAQAAAQTLQTHTCSC